MNFSIIIPNFNGEKYLISCLKSLSLSTNNCPHSKFEIIIVDNGSKNNSLLKIKNFKLKIISLPRNYGFGSAVNQGVKKAKYEYLVILNNDIVMDKNWFINIIRAITSNPNYTCYYGLVLNKDGTKIESQGFKFFPSGKATNINNNFPYIRNWKLEIKNFPIWGAPASLIIYKKEIFNKLGGFDERFFAYIEDVDFAYRLNKNNYQTLSVPSAISYHIGGATSNKINYLREWMTVKNWWIFILKNYTKTEIILNFFPIIIERLRNLKTLLVKLF